MRHILICALSLIALGGVALAEDQNLINNIPEPATIAMFVAGAGFIFARARRKKR